MDIWRKKSIGQLLAERKANKRGFARTLGAADLTALGVGAVIGTGIFVLTGVAAAKYAGPGVVFSFILSGIAAGLAAMVYAELAAAIPSAGSAYTFSYVSLGEIIAWLVGWNLILSYLVAAGAVAIGWSSYAKDLLQSVGLKLPLSFTASPFDGGMINLPAALIVLLVTGVIITGTQHSATANKIIVAAKLAAIALFIALGISHLNPANWRPLLPYGISGVFHGAAIVFFAYIGFDAVATAAEEVKNPQKDLPRSIILTLIISTTLYVVVAGLLTAMVKYTALDTASPVATALLMAGIPWASAVVSVGALAGLTSVLLVSMYSQSRIFFAMARDNLLPPVFDWLHPRFKTPVWDSVIIGLAVATIGAFLPIGLVAQLANIGTLTAFIAVSFGVIVLRQTNPELPRPFRLPLMPVIPLLTIISALYLIFNLPPLTWVEFIVWLGLGLLVYAIYGYKRSSLGAPRGTELSANAVPSAARKPLPAEEPQD